MRYLRLACLLVPILAACAGSAAPSRGGVLGSVNTPSLTTTPATNFAVVSPDPTTPMAIVSPSAFAEEVWAELRRRPLKLPKLEPNSRCPRSRSIHLPGTDEERGFEGLAIGKGPVYALGEVADRLVEYDLLAAPRWDEWNWYAVLWGIHPRYDGPVLVRGRQIGGPHELRFDDGADELRIGAGEGVSPGGWRAWPSAIRLPAPGCYAYQVDGLGFSQVVMFEAIPSPHSVGFGAAPSEANR